MAIDGTLGSTLGGLMALGLDLLPTVISFSGEVPQAISRNHETFRINQGLAWPFHGTPACST